MDGSFNFDTDVICSPDNTPVESNDQLTMVNMAGIFVLFGICFGASVSSSKVCRILYSFKEFMEPLHSGMRTAK